MSDEDATRVLTHYDLGKLRNCRRVERGYVNENWVVETSTGRYFLKHRCTDLQDPHTVTAQHALIQHLRDVGFPAPAVVPTSDGETFVELQSELYEIHEYIPGELYDLTRPAHFRQAARTLGWYHNAIEKFDHPLFHQPREIYGLARLASILKQLEERWHDHTTPQLDPLIAELNEHFRDLEARFSGIGELPELVIHGDYYADHLIFRDDEVVGVVDYDLARWTSRVIEIAEAVIYFATKHQNEFKHIVYSGVLELDAVYRFLASYCETVPLSEDEIRVLPHMIRTIWLCASLDPPLEPLLSLEGAPAALPEILTLAGWAQAHATDIVELGLDVRAEGA